MFLETLFLALVSPVALDTEWITIESHVTEPSYVHRLLMQTPSGYGGVSVFYSYDCEVDGDANQQPPVWPSAYATRSSWNEYESETYPYVSKSEPGDWDVWANFDTFYGHCYMELRVDEVTQATYYRTRDSRVNIFFTDIWTPTSGGEEGGEGNEGGEG